MDNGPGCKNAPRTATADADPVADAGLPRTGTAAPDIPVDIRSMRELQSLGILAQTLGLFALIAAWAVAEPAYRYDLKLLGILCALVSVGLIGMLFVKTPTRIFVLTTVTVSLLAEAFFQVASVSPLGNAWCLVIGIVFSLVMAPIFATVPQYVTALVIIALLLSRGHWIRLSPDQDVGWNLLLLGAVAVLGVFLNFSFSSLRQAGYRQRLTLEAMAYQDALTGLDNRRSAMERLRALQEQHRLQDAHFAMIDVDDFKQINDCFGHDHGDAVLQALAKAMRSDAAPHLVVRLGGEEFGLLVEAGDRAEATTLAQRLLDATHALDRHPAGAAAALQARLTISIGVASGRPGDMASDLLRRADAALYEAKRSGKNCYRVDGDPPTALPRGKTAGLPPNDVALA